MRARGRVGMSGSEIAEAKTRRARGESLASIGRLLGVSGATIKRITMAALLGLAMTNEAPTYDALYSGDHNHPVAAGEFALV